MCRTPTLGPQEKDRTTNLNEKLDVSRNGEGMRLHHPGVTAHCFCTKMIGVIAHCFCMKARRVTAHCFCMKAMAPVKACGRCPEVRESGKKDG